MRLTSSSQNGYGTHDSIPAIVGQNDDNKSVDFKNEFLVFQKYVVDDPE